MIKSKENVMIEMKEKCGNDWAYYFQNTKCGLYLTRWIDCIIASTVVSKTRNSVNDKTLHLWEDLYALRI